MQKNNIVDFLLLLQAGEHEGCYKDSFQERLLQGDMVKFREDNNPTR